MSPCTAQPNHCNCLCCQLPLPSPASQLGDCPAHPCSLLHTYWKQQIALRGALLQHLICTERLIGANPGLASTFPGNFLRNISIFLNDSCSSRLSLCTPLRYSQVPAAVPKADRQAQSREAQSSPLGPGQPSTHLQQPSTHLQALPYKLLAGSPTPRAADAARVFC